MTLVTYILPAYWASYLINGDASGLESNEEREIVAFLAGEGLGAPLGCGDESWFQRSNDANRLGGDVLPFTFEQPQRDTYEGRGA